MNPATNPRWNRKRLFVWGGLALSLALGLAAWWPRARSRAAGATPSIAHAAAATPASAPRAMPATTVEPYALFEQDCRVLAVRDEASAVAGEIRLARLVELAPFGRVRVEEVWREDAAGGDARLLRRDAFVAGEVLLMPRPGVSAEALAAVLRRAGATGWKRVPASDAWLASFPDPDLDTLPDALAALAAVPEAVAAAEGNGLGRGGRFPNDSRFFEQYSLLNTGQTGGTVGADVRATTAWDIRTTAPDVVVALLDSGIDYNHAELAPNVYRDSRELANGADDDGNGFTDDARGWDFVNGDNDPLDDRDHGSHVAGIIGAKGGNGAGVAGLAWEVQLLPVKILNASNLGSTANLLSGINYARVKGAKIMNLSLIDYPFSSSVSAAIDSANAAGVLLVISAGNSGTDNDAAPNYPSAYPQNNVIAVANTTDADVLSGGSNFGATTVDLAAPGTRVLSTVRGGTYALFSGTSMAAPHVAGTAALLRAMRPDATVADLRGWILGNVDSLPALAGRCVTGGRLNVAAALHAAQVLPVITTQPQGRTLLAGDTLTLTAAATSPYATGFQWFRDGVAIAGATGATFSLANAQAGDSGTYTVVVTNSTGSATSAGAVVAISPLLSAPVIASPPRDLMLPLGYGGAFTVSAGGTEPLSYQWKKDGVAVSGATSATLALANVQVADAGAYAVTVTNAYGSVSSPPAVLSVGRNSARMVALSTRGFVGTGDSILIPGVVTVGSAPKTLLIRAVGPTLGAMGVSAALADPVLTVFNSSAQPILSNDDWGSAPNLAALNDAVRDTGDFPLPAGSKDAALLTVLPTGLYTVQATGKGGATGNALVEIYELPSAATDRMTALSTRGFVGTGDSILIPGVVVSGGEPKTLLLRVVGPTLAAAGVSNVLADPVLTVFDAGGRAILANDDWGTAANAAAVVSATQAVGDFALPAGSKDAVVLAVLVPGLYTVQAAGKNGATGNVLVEIYEVP